MKNENSILDQHPGKVEPGLDWGNFEGLKINVEWKPDGQELIYTAINFRDGEWGDADDDAAQQIVERLLVAWKDAVTTEQITFENAVRLLKERDEAVRAEEKQWRLRRDAEGSRDAAYAAADSNKLHRDHLRRELKVAIAHIEHMAAFISNQRLGYSFESLGEDMPEIKSALEQPKS